MYHSLCCWWKPDMTEEAIIKLIPRNINSRMASKLQGGVNTAEELVRLSQQLDQDKLSQTLYDQRKNSQTNRKEIRSSHSHNL